MFEYLIDKIRDAPFETAPFRHIELQDFLAREHFEEIVRTPQIDMGGYANDQELVEALSANGWEPITFPGTTTNVSAYMKWHKRGGRHTNNDTCEGYGIAYRMSEPQTPLLKDLREFLSSEPFTRCLADKFEVDHDAVYQETGIQKYLDGYEISPHPDIRKKAVTFMVNINPAQDSESLNFHTHYLTFKKDHSYVQEYWRHNVQADRCWVPWDWCESHKQQTRNNSVVLFSPSAFTMHAVKASYDHLATQRTQLYGNLWYNECETALKPEWQNFVVHGSRNRISEIAAYVPERYKKPIRALLGR